MVDTVNVTGLVIGDIVKVYNVATQGKSLGSATVATGKNQATVSISQITEGDGNIYVSVTSKFKLESERVEASYIAEKTTPNPDEAKIIVINNIGKNLVLVYGLNAGDAVKIYNSPTGGKPLATAKVAVNQSYATITITQVGESSGSIYVSVTSRGLKESGRVKK